MDEELGTGTNDMMVGAVWRRPLLALEPSQPGWARSLPGDFGMTAAGAAPYLLVLSPPTCGSSGAAAMEVVKDLALSQSARGGEWLLQMPVSSVRWRSDPVKELQRLAGAHRARGGTTSLEGKRGRLPAWLASCRAPVLALGKWRSEVRPESPVLLSLEQRDLVLEDAVAEVMADDLGGIELDLGSLPAEGHIDVKGLVPGAGLAEAADTALAASAHVDKGALFLDALSGLRLDPRLVAQAMAEELRHMALLNVYSCVPRSQAPARPLPVKWIDTNKGRT